MDALYKSEFNRLERTFSKQVSHKQEEQWVKLEASKEMFEREKSRKPAGLLSGDGNSMEKWLHRFQKKAAFTSLFSCNITGN